MVIGLDTFIDYFKEYQDSYILIGGAATDVWMDELGLPFRVTKDLDIIIVIEALESTFVKHFWNFIKNGDYEIREGSYNQPKVYRFIKPRREGFPEQIELFARKPDILGDFTEAHLTPIPLGAEMRSLSAILMDEDYYAFTKENSDIIRELHLATTPTIICLKAKAFLDIRERLRNEDWKDGNERRKLEKDYKKHRNDIIRVSLVLGSGDSIELKNPMAEDLKSFIDIAKDEVIDYKQLARNFGVGAISPEDIFNRLKEVFHLK